MRNRRNEINIKELARPEVDIAVGGLSRSVGSFGLRSKVCDGLGLRRPQLLEGLRSWRASVAREP